MSNGTPTPEELELLIKVMKMTTADNEPQALVAIRKANTLLAKWGADWERLLRGKVRIVEDPFKNIPGMAPKPAGVAQPAPQRRTPPQAGPAFYESPEEKARKAAEAARVAAELAERERKRRELEEWQRKQREREMYEKRSKNNIQNRRRREIPLEDLI